MYNAIKLLLSILYTVILLQIIDSGAKLPGPAVRQAKPHGACCQLCH